MTLQPEIITSLDGLRRIGPEWNDLLTRSGCRHPFLSADWLTMWFTHLGQSRTLLVVAVRSAEGQLVGIAPMSVERISIGGIPVRRLCFLGDRHVGSDYLGFLVEGEADQAIKVIASAIAAKKDLWDYVELADTDPEVPYVARFCEALQPAVSLARTATASACPYAPLPAAFEQYFAALGSNLRSKLRRLGRRLAEKGALEWTEHTSGPELLAAYDDLIDLHGRRFDDRGDASSFLAPAAQLFHRAVLPGLAARNWVRIYSLRLDGKAIATLMGYQTSDKFLFYQAGMDPDLSEMRPGQLLMSHTIERAVQLGCVEYDFLRGSEAYKQMWANAVRHTVTVTLYGHGWRAQVARAAHWLRSQARAHKRRFEKPAAPAPQPVAESS